MGEWIKKHCGILSAIEKNETLSCMTTWVDLKGIILREISQTERQIPYDLSYTWDLKQTKNKTKTQDYLKKRKKWNTTVDHLSTQGLGCWTSVQSKTCIWLTVSPLNMCFLYVWDQSTMASRGSVNLESCSIYYWKESESRWTLPGQICVVQGLTVIS